MTAQPHPESLPRARGGALRSLDWLVGSRGFSPRVRVARVLSATLLVTGVLLVYSQIQGLVTPHATFESSLDHAIPFVPAFLIPYMLFFPFVLIAATLCAPQAFHKLLFASLISAALGWLCFLLLPATMTRPSPELVEPAWLRWAFERLYRIDDTHNTFPSLHVATTWICLLGFRGRRYFWPAAAAGALIVSSTLLVKQHTLVDVAGGSLLACSALWLASLLTARRQAREPRAAAAAAHSVTTLTLTGRDPRTP